MLRGRSPDELAAIGSCVRQAMTDALSVPERDRFQVWTEHDSGQQLLDRRYLDIARSDGGVLVHITLSGDRPTAAPGP